MQTEAEDTFVHSQRLHQRLGTLVVLGASVFLHQLQQHEAREYSRVFAVWCGVVMGGNVCETARLRAPFRGLRFQVGDHDR